VNQTRPHCVNQMGNTWETHTKLLAARHGRGTAWTRHAMCESTFISYYAGCGIPGSQEDHVNGRSYFQEM